MRACIAIVEDDADERTALTRVFRASGFDVLSYVTAEDFLGGGSEPICLVVDLQLNGKTGLDLLRELRTRGSTLPVIVITASDDADARAEAEHLGCLAFLHKPFQGRALVALLRPLVERRRSPHGSNG